MAVNNLFDFPLFCNDKLELLLFLYCYKLGHSEGMSCLWVFLNALKVQIETFIITGESAMNLLMIILHDIPSSLRAPCLLQKDLYR